MSPIFRVMATIPDTEAVVRRCFSKWVFLNFLQYSQENTRVGAFFLIKLHAFRPATLLKRGSSTVVFL